MKVGDLVRFRRQSGWSDPATGIIVELDNQLSGRVGIAWSFLDGRIGYQNANEVEVISASR